MYRRILYLVISVALVVLLTASHVNSLPIQKSKNPQTTESSDASGMIIEEVVQIPMVVKGLFKDRQVLLEGTLFRQEGSGPFPLVILNHGYMDPVR